MNDDNTKNEWDKMSPITKLFWISLILIIIVLLLIGAFPFLADTLMPCLALPMALSLPTGIFALFEFLDSDKN